MSDKPVVIITPEMQAAGTAALTKLFGKESSFNAVICEFVYGVMRPLEPRAECPQPHLTDCLLHRCQRHYDVPQFNSSEHSGAECGACIAQESASSVRCPDCGEAMTSATYQCGSCGPKP